MAKINRISKLIIATTLIILAIGGMYIVKSTLDYVSPNKKQEFTEKELDILQEEFKIKLDNTIGVDEFINARDEFYLSLSEIKDIEYFIQNNLSFEVKDYKKVAKDIEQSTGNSSQNYQNRKGKMVDAYSITSDTYVKDEKSMTTMYFYKLEDKLYVEIKKDNIDNIELLNI